VQLAELKANSQRQQALEHEHQQLQGAIAQWRSSHPELDDAGLDRLLAIDDAQLGELRQRLQAAEKAIEQGRVLLQEREQRLQQHAASHGELRPKHWNTPRRAATAVGHPGAAMRRTARQQADDQRRQQATRPWPSRSNRPSSGSAGRA
jgi:exonuclease SbcC